MSREQYLALKRTMDVIASVLLLISLSPLFAAIFLVIRLGSSGPALFAQERLGRNGSMFVMWKFRSMLVNAADIRNPDGSTFNAVDDPRVTAVGRLLRSTSLDELPQLWNVLKGDMSLGGGRPDVKDALLSYTPRERVRLLVTPGLPRPALIVG